MEQKQDKTTQPAKKLEKTIRSGTRQLYVPLTQDEKNAQVKEMLANMDARAQCESDITRLQESVKLKKGNVDLIDEAIGGCASKIKHGILKPIKCDTLYDWEGKKVIVTRLDTNEVIVDTTIEDILKKRFEDFWAQIVDERGRTGSGGYGPKQSRTEWAINSIAQKEAEKFVKVVTEDTEKKIKDTITDQLKAKVGAKIVGDLGLDKILLEKK